MSYCLSFSCKDSKDHICGRIEKFAQPLKKEEDLLVASSFGIDILNFVENGRKALAVLDSEIFSIIGGKTLLGERNGEKVYLQVLLKRGEESPYVENPHEILKEWCVYVEPGAHTESSFKHLQQEILE